MHSEVAGEAGGAGRVDLTWAVVETAAGRPASAGLELVAGARRLGRRVEAFTWGRGGGADAAAVLGRHGVGRVYWLGALDGGVPAPLVAAAMARHAETGRRAEVILLPATGEGVEVAARLSVRLDRPVLGDVVDLRAGAPPVARYAAPGGVTLVTARFTGDPPWLYLVRPGSFAVEDVGGEPAEVVRLEAPHPGRAAGARVVTGRLPKLPAPALEAASVVVAGGRGVGDASGFELVERLARLLHGAAAATGAAVEAGWAPATCQVGQTGRTVRPALYIAWGISGASQHTAGMTGARHIVAVNTDRDAPIMSMADLAIVGDVAKVLPRLIEAITSRRSSHTSGHG